jgi:DNA-binding protein H-NS
MNTDTASSTDVPAMSFMPLLLEAPRELMADQDSPARMVILFASFSPAFLEEIYLMPDTKFMSYAEIQKRIKDMDAERAELEAALQAKRGEEIKVLADAYAKKLQAGGFSISEGIKALAPYDTKAGTRSGTAPRPPREVETGTTYRNPETGETWKAGAKGRVVGWLQAQIDAGKRASSFATEAG